MESKWLTWAKKLQAISSTGLHYSENEYDRERYQDVAMIAQSMLAELGNLPIERIEGLLSDFARGYATPKVDVRGAVIHQGQVLLVRERSDGLWTLPGGFADIGLSPAENIVKEIWEEARIRVSATTLYSVRHKAKWEYEPDIRDFYKLFFLCRQLDVGTPTPGSEILDARYFLPNMLPPLSRGRVIESDIQSAFACYESATPSVSFD